MEATAKLHKKPKLSYFWLIIANIPNRMDNFIVSARKYRPQTFDTVVGQSSITGTLKNAIRNKQLAQAFLFCGPRGVGKTTCARILAKTINCSSLNPEGEACDHCESCVSFNQNASFNIFELDGASNNSVDGIRTLVDQVRIPPQTGLYKVYIIDEVHMLSASAFNAFLKTLEEPPAYAKFILATTEKHKILPTILSRCQIFDFRRITVEDIAGHLRYVAEKERITIDDNARHVIAQKADGAMRDALSIFDQLVSFAGDHLTYEMVLENLNVLDHEYFFRITGQIIAGDTAGTLLTINDIIDKGFEGQHFIIGFGEHLRNLLVGKDPVTLKLLETAPSIRERYLEQSKMCQVGLLLKLLDLNNRCDLSYKSSNNKKLHLEITLMQMCALSLTPETATVPVQPSAPGPQETVAAPLPKVKPPDPPASSAEKSASAEPGKAQEPMRMKDVRQKFSATEEQVKGTHPDRAETGQDRPKEAEAAAEPFTVDALLKEWDEFAETIRSSHPHLYTNLKTSRPELGERWSVTFMLDNKVLGSELMAIRGELTEWLRSRLKNRDITLQTSVAEPTATRKPYTDREKFDQMAGRNPNLLELRETLDLDIEY